MRQEFLMRLARYPESHPSARATKIGPGGGTGRHKGLKIPCPQGRAGSSPAPGTTNSNPIPHRSRQRSTRHAHDRQSSTLRAHHREWPRLPLSAPVSCEDGVQNGARVQGFALHRAALCDALERFGAVLQKARKRDARLRREGYEECSCMFFSGSRVIAYMRRGFDPICAPGSAQTPCSRGGISSIRSCRKLLGEGRFLYGPSAGVRPVDLILLQRRL